jgi:hypothetical protein
MFSQFAEELPQLARARRERLAATEPYSAGERLTLAVDALERAVIHVADLERELVKFFVGRGDDTDARVVFEPEEFEEAQPVVLELLLDGRQEALERLRSVIAEVQREASLDANH